MIVGDASIDPRSVPSHIRTLEFLICRETDASRMGVEV
jgi:hypothetical protein